MKSLLGSLCLTAGLFGVCSSVYAQENQAGVQTRANVIEACRITSASTLNFNQYDATDTHRTANLDASSTFGLRCNRGTMNGVVLIVSIDGGQNSFDGDCRNRQLSDDGGNLIRYELSTAVERHSNLMWGCDASHRLWRGGTGFDSGNNHNIQIWGRIPAGQSVPAGSYRDTITLSLSF